MSSLIDLLDRRPGPAHFRYGFWLPLMLVVAVCAAANLAIVQGMLKRAAPLDPWESALVVAAQQTALGQNTYRSAELSEATHMYGPVLQQITGAAFAVAGPSNRTGRCVSLAATALLVGLLIAVLSRRRDPAHLILYAALYLSINNDIAGYFAFGKADILALLFAFAGVLAHVRAMRAASWAWTLLAGAVGILTFLTKQNIAGLTLVVPAGYFLNCLLRVDRASWAQALRSITPAACVLLFVQWMRVHEPLMFLYLLRVPASNPIPPREILAWLSFAVTALPLTLAVLALALAGTGGNVSKNFRRGDAYLVAALGLALGISVLSAAKFGGTYNSMAPFLFALVALSIRLYERSATHERLQEFAGRSMFNLLLLTFSLSILWWVTAFPVDNWKRWGSSHAELSRDYAAVIEQVRHIPGDAVLSPEDPTITLYAGKAPGFNSYVVRDYTRLTGLPEGRWPTDSLVQLMTQACHVVEVKFLFWGFLNSFDPQVLADHGLVKTWENANYALWSNRQRNGCT